jgi:hypothetical protein
VSTQVPSGETAKAAVAASKPSAAQQQAASSKAAQQQQAAATAQADEAEAEEGEEEEEGSAMFSRSVIYTLTACGVSMVAHCMALVMMGMMVLAMPAQPVTQEIVAEVDEPPEEVVNQVLEEEIKPSKELALVSTAVSSVVGAQGAVSALSQPQVAAQQVSTEAPTQVQVDVGEVNVFKSNGKHLSSDLPEGQLGEAAAIAETYAEAMDRITQEILGKLAKGKVLVVWVHDQSGSMKDDRDEINARIDRVYQELGLASQAKGDALMTAVTSYGATYNNIHTKAPTSNIDEIRAAMDEVPIDESGIEMMCQGIGFAIQSHRKFVSQGNRQMIVVVVTDESGDPATNVQYLESTIAEAKAARCPVYFLGRESVFGYPYARMRWEDPKTGLPFWLQIERGPETPLPELLQIDGFHRRWDANSSGFGPYEQCRIARQTGGVFFMLPSPETNLVGRDNRKYALEQMRPYLPDLGPRSDYIAERDKNELRRFLWKIIVDLNPYDKAHTGSNRVELRHTFPLKLDEFKKAALEEQQISKRMIDYMAEAEKALIAVERLRNLEASPRWRANYDLMLGQMYSYQIRIYQYGLALEAFMRNPMPVKNIYGAKRPTTNWHIEWRKQIFDHPDPKINAWMQDHIKLANEQYAKVVAEHAGTPYENRAKHELTRGYGIWFREEWDDPNLRRNVKVPKL